MRSTTASGTRKTASSPAASKATEVKRRPPVSTIDTIDYRYLIADSADVNIVASPDGVYRYVSSACLRLFGWEPGELEGHREDEFIHPHDLPSFQVARARLTGSKVVSASYRFLCRNGTSRWTETTSRLVEDQGMAMVVSAMRDITERQAHTTSLEQKAFTDPLTGVANRMVLMDRLHQGLRRLGRGGGLLAVLYLDLDRFKVVNDSLGHRVGDAVLVQMAERLVHHLRPADTLARMGGDEFVIVAEGLPDEARAVELGRRIIEAGRKPFRLNGEDFVCTVSVGVACTADSERSADDLLGEADLALYRAKDQGRDRSEVFDEELRTTAVTRLATERMLRRALDDKQLVVEYQPIIDIQTGCPVGAEALVRINDPDREGLLQPESFLEAAEETGLLISMDEQVLADAVKQASAWHSRLAGTEFAEVAINVTARHLADAGFQRAVIELLDEYRVAHDRLQIEVTERVLLEASNSAMTGLRALRASGVQVGLDDFGTGYSSLAYLREFPLDFVKIDKSFIGELEGDGGERDIVAAIIGLSHALNLIVVAEGVETEGQLRILENLQCDRAQGFLFARSLAPGDVDELVLARSRPLPVSPGRLDPWSPALRRRHPGGRPRGDAR
jgi:diguanylate cyclase (GGDEF)-like protein/PAS domain S-box-containing protein